MPWQEIGTTALAVLGTIAAPLIIWLAKELYFKVGPKELAAASTELRRDIEALRKVQEQLMETVEEMYGNEVLDQKFLVEGAKIDAIKSSVENLGALIDARLMNLTEHLGNVVADRVEKVINKKNS